MKLYLFRNRSCAAENNVADANDFEIDGIEWCNAPESGKGEYTYVPFRVSNCYGTSVKKFIANMVTFLLKNNFVSIYDVTRPQSFIHTSSKVSVLNAAARRKNTVGCSVTVYSLTILFRNRDTREGSLEDLIGFILISIYRNLFPGDPLFGSIASESAGEMTVREVRSS